MDFFDKKENFTNLLESFLEEKITKKILLESVKKLKDDIDFKDKKLFVNIFLEIENNLDELSKKDLKQRINFMKSFID